MDCVHCLPVAADQGLHAVLNQLLCFADIVEGCCAGSLMMVLVTELCKVTQSCVDREWSKWAKHTAQRGCHC